MTNRELKRFGLRYGAYNGANKRRHCIFESFDAVERRSEFDTKTEAMKFAQKRIDQKSDA